MRRDFTFIAFADRVASFSASWPGLSRPSRRDIARLMANVRSRIAWMPATSAGMTLIGRGAIKAAQSLLNAHVMLD